MTDKWIPKVLRDMDFNAIQRATHEGLAPQKMENSRHKPFQNNPNSNKWHHIKTRDAKKVPKREKKLSHYHNLIKRNYILC